MKQSDNGIEAIVDDICDEWWKSDGRETFISVGNDLLGSGLSLEEIEDVLCSLYGAVANEFT